MGQRRTMRFRRRPMVRKTWDGEGEALRLRLRNLICDAADEQAEDAEYFDEAATGEPMHAVPVRTLRGLIAWANPDDAEAVDDNEGIVIVASGSETVH